MNRVLLLVLVLLLAPLSAALAKPAPPERFLKLFEQLNGFESAFESQNWEVAEQSLGEVTATFLNLHDQLMLDAPEQTAAFEGVLQTMTRALENRNISQSNSGYIKLQQLLLGIADAYAFPRHPVLLLIESYLGEAIEAVEANNMVEVMLEVDEIQGLYPKAQEVLARHQTNPTQLSEVGSALDLLQRALQSQGREEIEQRLRDFQQRFGMLAQLFG